MGKLPDYHFVERIVRERNAGRDAKILKVMLKFYMEKRFNASFCDVANELGINVRNNAFQKRFNILRKEKNFIERGEGRGYQLTGEGLITAATPDIESIMMEQLSLLPQTNTNKEHQDRIKKSLEKPKSRIIFDFLLEYKHLNELELSTLAGVHIRNPIFLDSLKELRHKTYVKRDVLSKNFYLSSKCFLDGKDSCSIVDRKKLDMALAEGSARVEEKKKRYRHKGPRKNAKNHNVIVEREDISDDINEISSDEDEIGTIENSSNKRLLVVIFE